MSKHFYAPNGINLGNQDIINFKPHQVSSLPLSPFLGQMVFLDTIDGSNDANQTYQWDGTEWATITHHDLTIAAGSTDYLEISGHELSIKNLALGQVTVDNTYTTLALWISGTGYDGSQMQEGDVLILQAATDGQKTYIHKSGSAGDATDFVAMFDELTAAEVRGYFTDGEGTSYDSSDGSFDVGHDHSTININGSNELYVVDDAISTAKIQDSAVTELKIADNAVTNSKLADNAVNTAEITDNAVAQAKMADDSVGTAEIIDANVTEAKLATAVTDKLNDSYVGNVGNGSDTTFTVTHSLGTQDIIVSIRNTTDDKFVAFEALDGKAPTVNTITIDFGAETPTTDQYRIVIKKAV